MKKLITIIILVPVLLSMVIGREVSNREIICDYIDNTYVNEAFFSPDIDTKKIASILYGATGINEELLDRKPALYQKSINSAVHDFLKCMYRQNYTFSNQRDTDEVKSLFTFKCFNNIENNKKLIDFYSDIVKYKTDIDVAGYKIYNEILSFKTFEYQNIIAVPLTMCLKANTSNYEFNIKYSSLISGTTDYNLIIFLEVSENYEVLIDSWYEKSLLTNQILLYSEKGIETIQKPDFNIDDNSYSF